jgi:glycerophosphoryl diester phosphodiesterase
MSASPLVIAHRGSTSQAVPENTLPAFAQSLELGADMIELDVRRTRDREAVVVHDARVTGRPVSKLSRTEMAHRGGVEPPRLDEVLTWAQGRIPVDVELKEGGYADELLPTLTGFAAGGGELLVTSFLDGVLDRFRHLRTGLLFKFTAARAVARARACGADTLVVRANLVTERRLAEWEESGLKLLVWHFEIDRHAHLLANPTVSGVITDDVAAALHARTAPWVAERRSRVRQFA